jgi:UDP-2-acetamido-3-amino-2,3-dideoxy-glucuronate N-acetyltransferase
MPDFYVHESSIVEERVQIGKGTKIWHFSHIMPDVVIGENCSFGQNTFIASHVRIGNNVRVQNNVSIYEGVTLEDDVFCGPSCVFTNVVNPRASVSRKREYKKTLVMKGATLGANCTIVCGHTIGRYAFIGAGSVVTSDVPYYSLFYGNPARFRDFVCKCGEREKLIGNVCARCGTSYSRL